MGSFKYFKINKMAVTLSNLKLNFSQFSFCLEDNITWGTKPNLVRKNFDVIYTIIIKS